ncbi:MAG: hypothetical protein ACLR0U_22805 [Enterocloster clostridioformis]
MKLDTTVVTMWRMLSGARRFTACTVFCEISPLALSRKSYVTDTPRAAQIADSYNHDTCQYQEDGVAGLGRPFPTRSTVSKCPDDESFFSLFFVITIPPLVYAIVFMHFFSSTACFSCSMAFSSTGRGQAALRRMRA